MSKVENSTILIVNDAPDALDLMRLQLRQAGYQVLTATNGREGFEIARYQCPDMVISDVAMPEVNGIDLCHMIRAEDGLRTVPIMLVSAIHKDDAKVVDGLKAGADDYLEVPYNQPRLVAKVARLLERKRAEGALKFQAHLLNTVEQAVIATDLGGKITYWNGFAETLYGWSATEAIGGNVLELVSAKTTIAQASEIMSHLREGRSWSGEFPVRRKDGTSFPAMVTDSPIYDDKGALVGIVGVSFDITERKKAEEALQQVNDDLEQRVAQRTSEFVTANAILKEEIRERKRAEEALKQSEQDYRGLFEQAHDAILVVAPEREIVLDVNERACEIYGFSRSEFIGMSLEAISKDVARGKAKVAETLERGDPFNFETVQYRKDGTEILLEINASAVCYQGQKAILSINRDITERKLAQEALKESEERYRAFINQSSEAIWRFELETPIAVTLPEDEQVELFYRYGYLAECNMAMARMYGYSSPEEIVGARLGDLLIRSDPQNTEILRAAIRMGHQLAEVESHEVDRDGHSKWFLNNFVGIIEDGFLIRLWGTQRDVTERKRVEEARRRAEEKYHSIFENAVEGIFQSTPDGRFLSVNPAMAHMYGYDSPEEMIAERTDIERQHYVDPERRAEFKRLLEEQEGIVQGFESEVFRKDRSKFWTSESVRAVGDQKGALLCYEGFVEDITERKRAQEALRESVEQNRAILRAIPDLMFLQTDDGVYLDCHAKDQRELLVAPEVFLGKNMRDVLSPDLVEKLFCCFHRAKESDEPQVIEYTLLVQREERHYEARIVRSNRDKILTIVRNITERKRAEEELRLSEEIYRRLVELSPDTIIVVSEGKIDYINPAGVKFFGATSPEQIVGLPALDFVHPDFIGLVKERMRQAQEGKKTELVEQKHVRLDGRVVNVEVTGIGITYRGKRGAQVIIRDITERVRARDARMQLQLRLLTAQEEERHRISRELHDQMGQHLPALMLGLKALKDSGQNGPLAINRLQQLQDLAERTARDAHALARDLRPAMLDDFGLHTALSNYIDEWSDRCGISVDFHSTGFDEDERLSPHIEITLYRTVQEALTNVIKHAQAEHVSLILEQNSESVLAVIEDDGKGFNVETVLGTPISERRLGLLGMQERVELVGGTLTIESAQGAGTTVAVRIPTLTR